MLIQMSKSLQLCKEILQGSHEVLGITKATPWDLKRLKKKCMTLANTLYINVDRKNTHLICLDQQK